MAAYLGRGRVSAKQAMGGPIGGRADSGDPGAMASPYSALDPEAIALARSLLVRPRKAERLWPVLAAAGILALSALAFATAMIMVPPLVSEPASRMHDAG